MQNLYNWDAKNWSTSTYVPEMLAVPKLLSFPHDPRGTELEMLSPVAKWAELWRWTSSLPSESELSQDSLHCKNSLLQFLKTWTLPFLSTFPGAFEVRYACSPGGEGPAGKHCEDCPAAAAPEAGTHENVRLVWTQSQKTMILERVKSAYILKQWAPFLGEFTQPGVHIFYHSCT